MTMNSSRRAPSRALTVAAACALLALALPGQASPLTQPLPFAEFGGPDAAAGSGGLLFAPSFGFGGWIGVLQATAPGGPVFDTLASFAAVDNPGSGGFDISGDFFFVFRDVDGLTPVDDVLQGTLVGTLMSDATDPALQRVDVAYTVTGGSGLFAGFTGFGQSMFSYDSAGFEPYSYAGGGTLFLRDPAAVPEPGTLALAALGLLAVARLRRSVPAPGAPLAR